MQNGPDGGIAAGGPDARYSAASWPIPSAPQRLSELAERLPLVCRTSYRESQRVSPRKGPVLVVKGPDSRASAAFPRLVLTLRHGGDGYEARTLHTTVKTVEGTMLFSVLYQLAYDADPPNFLGPHGFTGLFYVSDPESAAQLQFSVRAESHPRPSPPAGPDADAPVRGRAR